jgi:hypothetical protein
VFAVQGVEVAGGGDEELTRVHVFARARHRQQPLLVVLQPLADLVVEKARLEDRD